MKVYVLVQETLTHSRSGETHLLDPVLLKGTKGLVLSESLLEKLERRFPWFPDCCRPFSPDWVERRRGGGTWQPWEDTKEGWGQTKTICKSSHLLLWDSRGVFVAIGEEKHVFKCKSFGLRRGFTGCKSTVTSWHPVTSSNMFYFRVSFPSILWPHCITWPMKSCHPQMCNRAVCWGEQHGVSCSLICAASHHVTFK